MERMALWMACHILGGYVRHSSGRPRESESVIVRDRA